MDNAHQIDCGIRDCNVRCSANNPLPTGILSWHSWAQITPTGITLSIRADQSLIFPLLQAGYRFTADRDRLARDIPLANLSAVKLNSRKRQLVLSSWTAEGGEAEPAALDFRLNETPGVMRRIEEALESLCSSHQEITAEDKMAPLLEQAGIPARSYGQFRDSNRLLGVSARAWISLQAPLSAGVVEGLRDTQDEIIETVRSRLDANVTEMAAALPSLYLPFALKQNATTVIYRYRSWQMRLAAEQARKEAAERRRAEALQQELQDLRDGKHPRGASGSSGFMSRIRRLFG